MTREPDFSKYYTLNVFHVKPISIGLNFLFQLALQNQQVKFNLSQMPLLWPTGNMNKFIFGGLASAFKASNKLVAENSIATHIAA